MRTRIAHILTLLLAAAAALSCSKADMSIEDMAGNPRVKSIVITGIVTDAQNGQPLENITIHFKAYPKDSPDAAPIIIDEVHTNSKGEYTIQIYGDFHEPLLCTLSTQDSKDTYETKTNQVIISWNGTSFDKNSGTFVINDCSFQLSKR
jgi:putative lipoprotein (rSAM/lipoprotein system)